LSISAAPNGSMIRFTFKEFGDGTRALANLRPGTRLVLEGPYGAMHEAHERDGRRGVLLIAGGIGITPIRAIAETIVVAPGHADLIYRSQSAAEAPLLEELRALAKHKGIRLHTIFGRRGEGPVGPDPLGPAEIKHLVPDAADRDVYLCGPTGLMDRVRASLREIGTPDTQVHFELFS
jgi:predicted ferric reductase